MLPLSRHRTRSRWLPAPAVVALAIGVMGCGMGWRAREREAAAGEPSNRRQATGNGQQEMPGGSGSTSTAGTEAAVAEAELGGEHDDELTALPGPEGAGDGLAPASLNGAVPTASKYASLDRAACEAELGKRHIPFERVGEARGVIAPLRLKGAIAGVEFHSMLPAAQRRTSPYEIYDCRLVLALDDWARVLVRHDVVEVVHYSVYRPPPKKAVLTGPGRRHSGALAIDAAIFKTRDGRTMSVEKDFHGRIGSKPCGTHAAPTAGLPAQAVTLRQIVCEAADAQLFNVMLTPDYNWPHRNHFHLEVTAGARWVLVR